MRVETKLQPNEIRKICPRCNNSIVIEGVDDIDFKMEYEDVPFIVSDWGPPKKVPYFFCICPVCTERINIPNSDLTEIMQEKILQKNKWYYRLLKKFKITFI